MTLAVPTPYTPLSARWAGNSARLLTTSTSDVQRLAIALGPVRSIIRVIDDHVPPMTVDWAQVGQDDKGRPMSKSYTDFGSDGKGARIAINPLPIQDEKLTAGMAIDIVTGFAMHEASHGKHSRDRYKDLLNVENGREVPAFRPMRVAAYLWNLVEDVRIEGDTSHDWPGFAPYFDTVLGWVWDEMIGRSILPRKYKGADVAEKLKLVFLACRYPERAEFVWAKDKTMREEAAWWKAWQADYLASRTTVRETIQLGLDHLMEDKGARQEMDKMTGAEQREEAAGERMRAQIERLMKEGIAGTYGVCVTEDGDVIPLSAEEAEAVDKLVREQLTLDRPILTGNGAECEVVRVSKPEEDSSSRAAYIGQPSALVESMRSALVFRAERPEYDLKLQKSGEVDDEEIYRLAMDDYRIFTERVIDAKPDVLFGLLVDMSGSMAGRKLKIAQRLAQTLVWAVQDMPGVETHVWGHTGDGIGSEGADIYRLYEPGDPLRRLGLIDSLYHGNNYDGFAIAWCADKMRDREQPQKVLIVLSDGLPSGRYYGHDAGQRHVRQVCDWSRSQGVEVIQIAIDPSGIRPQDQEAMFGPGNWIGYESDTALPRQLTKVVSRWA